MKALFILLLTLVLFSCRSQEKKIDHSAVQNSPTQIGQYVGVFIDSHKNLWVETLEKGVARYNGKKLEYFTTIDGLPSNRIVNIIEDKNSNLWFGTGNGISKYDGNSFTNFSEEDGLCSNMISTLFIDTQKRFWIGTWNGVCTYDGVEFKNFPIPNPKVETPINPDTQNWITSIYEDSKGNIWIGRDGYGITIYDGNNLVQLTTADGLNSNNIQAIQEDKQGNMWIGTRVAEKDNINPAKRKGEGGLNKYDGAKFIQFPEHDGLYADDVYTIYKDRSDNLWFSTLHNGVYKYSDDAFMNYKLPHPIMDILEDENGTIWLGCAGGLYKMDQKGNIVNVTTEGPW